MDNEWVYHNRKKKREKKKPPQEDEGGWQGLYGLIKYLKVK